MKNATSICTKIWITLFSTNTSLVWDCYFVHFIFTAGAIGDGVNFSSEPLVAEFTPGASLTKNHKRWRDWNAKFCFSCS